MGRVSEARDKLIATAAGLFYTHGYNAVGIQEICDAAEVKKGSFYYFFATKRDLALAVIDRNWQMYRDGPLKLAFAQDAPLEEQFRRYFEQTCAWQRRTTPPLLGCPFGNLAVELSIQDPLIRQKLQDVFHEWIDILEGVLRRAVERGAAPAMNTRQVAESIMALYEGTAVLAKTFHEAELIERMAHVVALLIHPPLPGET